MRLNFTYDIIYVLYDELNEEICKTETYNLSIILYYQINIKKKKSINQQTKKKKKKNNLQKKKKKK